MFFYDGKIVDKENAIRIDVTISDPDNDFVLFTLQSGRLRVPFCLALDKAAILAEMIRYALEERECAATKTSTQTSETDEE